MKALAHHRLLLLAGILALLPASRLAAAGFLVQCPGDLNSDAIPDPFLLDANGHPTTTPNPAYRPNVKCMHITCGDGFQTMADGTPIYTFGFRDVTGTPAADAAVNAFLAAEWPAPTIALDEGDEFYLTLSNVNFALRPDLFDPHTVHFHGFPQASSVFDGMPEGSIGILGGNSLTYYYKIVIPGTYMYHCHQEAAEHMQQGMLGNLYVRPKQDKAAAGTVFGTHVHQPGDLYAYNDGDGSTFVNKEIPIQVGSFDPEFHTLTVLGIPMKVVAKDARLLRGPTGRNLYYDTTSVTLGGGETADVILDTAQAAPGTYFLYSTRLNHLCNDQEDYGGMMTEIIIQ